MLGVFDDGDDLAAVADDAGVLHQLRDLCFIEAGDRSRLEVREGRAESLALFENGDPRKPRLHPLEGQQLEERAIVVRGAAPLMVVVIEVDRLRSGPAAACRLRHVIS